MIRYALACVLVLSAVSVALAQKDPLSATDCVRNVEKQFLIKQKEMRSDFITCINDAGEHILNRHICLRMLKMRSEVDEMVLEIKKSECGETQTSK